MAEKENSSEEVRKISYSLQDWPSSITPLRNFKQLQPNLFKLKEVQSQKMKDQK